MGIYVNGIGAVTIQEPSSLDELKRFTIYKTNYVRCIEPDFPQYINPIQSRRMSRIIKRAIVSARMSLKDAGVEMPDAIISGTGLGCIEDTEKFLSAMIDNDEKFLQPTHFIQSTHNTISSQIAINLSCYGYNSTYSHLGTSFESALLDAFLQLCSDDIHSVLVGGYDEMTPAYYSLLQKIGYWKAEPEMPLTFNSGSNGSMAGEGSISLLLSDHKASNCYCELKGVTSFYKLDREETFHSNLLKFLESASCLPGDIDTLILGVNGDGNDFQNYNYLSDTYFKNASKLWYKHISGEFFTSPAFSLLLAARSIKSGRTDEIFYHEKQNKTIKNVLIYNHFKNKMHSFILLGPC